MQNSTHPKSDIYQDVTDRILAKLEQGVAPWRKPWTVGRRPSSMSTGKAYSGINPLLLGMTAMEAGYSSPFWGTYRQITELGGQVRKGEKSTEVVFFKQLTVDDRDARARGEERSKQIPMLRSFRVFNAGQADSLPERYYPQAAAFEPDASAQDVIEAYLASGNAAELRHDVHGRAYYSPAADTIHMTPQAEHRSTARYYSTAFHELVHSTGHGSRLDRPGIAELDHFGSGQYGKEELVAEMGAAMLAAETGVETDASVGNSAAYLHSWITAIKGDRKLLVSAASQAAKASDLVLEPSRARTGELAAA